MMATTKKIIPHIFQDHGVPRSGIRFAGCKGSFVCGVRPGLLAGILMVWWGIALIFSSVMPVLTGRGRSGWPGS